MIKKVKTTVGRIEEDTGPKIKRDAEGVIIPLKTVAANGDLLYVLRERRLEMERAAAEVAKDEAVIRDHIIYSLPKEDATGVRGKIANTSIRTVRKWNAKDWTKVQAYIKKHNAFDLLQRRINETAVEARFEEGEKIPGMEPYNATTVSCTKIGSKK